MRRTVFLLGAVLALAPTMGQGAPSDKAQTEPTITPLPSPTVTPLIVTPLAGPQKPLEPLAPFLPLPVIPQPQAAPGLTGLTAAVAAAVTAPILAAKPAPSVTTQAPPPLPVAATPPLSKEPPSKSAKMWTNRAVNLRVGPSVESRVLAEVDSGVEVETVDDPRPIEGWTRIRLKHDGIGYVSTSYLTARASQPRLEECALPEDHAAAARTIAPGTLVRATADAFMRLGPSCSDKVVDTLEKGRRMTVRGVEGNWYRVEGQGWPRVYIRRGLLEPVK